MAQLHISKSVGLALGLAGMAFSAPLAAASVDYFLEIDGVKGESSKSKKQRKWVELTSLRAVDGGTTQGKVNVAVGDVNGDGRATEAGRPATPGSISSGTENTTALLLPAVQKVREATARMPAWKGCAVGQKLKGVKIKQQSTGRTGRILDATVSGCAMEQISFNFTKITWN